MSTYGSHAGLGARHRWFPIRRRWCPTRRRWCPRRRRWCPRRRQRAPWWARIALCKTGAEAGTIWLARGRFRQLRPDGECPFCITLRGRIQRSCEVLLVIARCYRGGDRRRLLGPGVGWGRRSNRQLPSLASLLSLWRHGLPVRRFDLTKRIMHVCPLEAADGRRGAVPSAVAGAVPGATLELGAALGARARRRRAARGHREAWCEPRTRGRRGRGRGRGHAADQGAH